MSLNMSASRGQICPEISAVCVLVVRGPLCLNQSTLETSIRCKRAKGYTHICVGLAPLVAYRSGNYLLLPKHME
jgi:hypothetical protein